MARYAAGVAVVVLAGGLAGCMTEKASLPSSSSPVAGGAYQTIPSDGLVGRWGLASYRDEKDRARTTAMARSQCRNAYVIKKGPTDGVMMHVADDPKLYELALKRSGDGKTYLGFAAPPGDRQDREVLEMSSNEMTMRFVDPDANTRYGTFIYVRC
ncbi:hypothetical protein [Enterovirga rhinocerotis]|nr:hypothetical protein [Enterovirga rhinocerotis]